MMDAQTFAALPPVPEQLLIGGETIDLVPLKVGELPIFARAVRPIASKIGPAPDWLSLLAEDGDAVLLALSIACRRPQEWVSSLALDDAIRLAEAVFEVNADFFIRHVVPEIMRVSQSIGARFNGPIPSPGSSDPAIVTTTS